MIAAQCSATSSIVGRGVAATQPSAPPDFEAETIADFMVLGHIMTAAPPLDAIASVVTAAPGIATYNDLPLVLPRGTASSP